MVMRLLDGPCSGDCFIVILTHGIARSLSSQAFFVGVPAFNMCPFCAPSRLRSGRKDDSMPYENVLSEKEQDLIAVGASVAAGCQPSAAYHVPPRNVCACDRSIALAG